MQQKTHSESKILYMLFLVVHSRFPGWGFYPGLIRVIVGKDYMTRIITGLNDCQETPYYVSIIII